MNLWDKILANRFEFHNLSNRVGFPHLMLTITEWGDYLPRFRGIKFEPLGDHLLNFHKCMLEHVFFHDDVLIKMFIFSLEQHDCEWCQSLPATRIHSLKEFHTILHHNYKIFYPDGILF